MRLSGAQHFKGYNQHIVFGHQQPLAYGRRPELQFRIYIEVWRRYGRSWSEVISGVLENSLNYLNVNFYRWI